MALSLAQWIDSNAGWFLIIGALLWKISYMQWRLDHGGKTARQIWREDGLDV